MAKKTKPGIRDPTQDESSWATSTYGKISSTARSANILCPYWIAHGCKEIHCATPYGSECRHILRFRTEDLKERHLEVWCCGRWDACEWSQCMQQVEDPDS